MKRIVLGIQITNRLQSASSVQQLFSKYGCNIKTRLGLHDVNENVCSGTGLVLLDMFGNETEICTFETEMRKIDGIQVQKMVFEA
jgi:hypothetical protein